MSKVEKKPEAIFEDLYDIDKIDGMLLALFSLFSLFCSCFQIRVSHVSPSTGPQNAA